MATTPNLGITYLDQNMAAKEIAINEALLRIDALLNTGAISATQTTPPTSPAEGDLYLIPAAATGAWSGKSGSVAHYGQGWRFVPPREGMLFWVNDQDRLYAYNGSSWLAAGGGPAYEEGTFTPYLYGTTGGTATYDFQQGIYTKIGRQVSFSIALRWLTNSITGQARIGGLPFTAGSGFANRTGFTVGYLDNMSLPGSYRLGGYIEFSANFIVLRRDDRTTMAEAVLPSDLSGVSRLFISGTYMV